MSDGDKPGGRVSVERGDTAVDRSQTTIDASDHSNRPTNVDASDHSSRQDNVDASDRSRHQTTIDASDRSDRSRRSQRTITTDDHRRSISIGNVNLDMRGVGVVIVAIVALVVILQMRTAAPPQPGPGVAIPPSSDTAETASPGDVDAPSANAPPREPGMTWVPPGEVERGTAGGTLRIAAGLLIDAHEVTNGEFEAFVKTRPEWSASGISPSAHDGDYLKNWPGGAPATGSSRHPVVYVTWEAAREYCRASGKRLPTEQEWEFAYRAGAPTAYWWGETWDPSRAVGEADGTAEVGGAARTNRLGLSDIAGNVWEWTASPGTDARGAGGYVVRGGSWRDARVFLTASSRAALPLTATGPDLGFRCVR